MALRNFFSDRFATPFLAGIAALIFYFSCLSPTVTYGGDCGELIAASWNGGIPHPTGYPLYAMLGWAFAHLLPLREVAWRYSLLSAIMGSLAVALVAAGVERLTKHRMAALVAALSLAGLYFYGSQSVIAEVYATNGALLALLFYAAIRWKLDKKWLWLAIVALGIGLIPNAHMSGIYLVPGIAVFLWPGRHSKGLFRQHSKRLAGLALLVLLGFSLTLYLPWRARQFPQPATGPGGTLIYAPQDWGHPATLQSWWNHLSARQYHSLLWKNQTIHLGDLKVTVPVFTKPLSHAGGQMLAWLDMMILQYLWLIVFTAWGALVCWKFAPRLGWLLWLPFGLNLFFQSNYKVDGVNDIANFLFPCYIVMALWTGIGYHAASQVLSRWKPEKQNLGRLALRAMAVSAILVQWVMVYPAINLRHDTRAGDTALERTGAAQALQDKTGKPPSVLMWDDDTLFPFWYAQKVLGKAPAAKTPWGPFRHYYSDRGRIVDLAAQLQNQGPVALAQWDAKTEDKFPLVSLNPHGTLWLASRNILPEPAKVLLNARDNSIKLHLPQAVKPGELFAGTLDFNFATSPPHQTLRRDPAHHSIQTGWVKVIYLSPEISQNGISSVLHQIRNFAESPIAQQLPLVIPDNLIHPVRLQMLLPLQIPRTFPGNSCDIWLSTGNGSWQRAATVTFLD